MCCVYISLEARYHGWVNNTRRASGPDILIRQYLFYSHQDNTLAAGCKLQLVALIKDIIEGSRQGLDETCDFPGFSFQYVKVPLFFFPPSTVDTYALRHLVCTKPSEGIYISSLTFFFDAMRRRGKNIQMRLFF